MDTSLPLPPLPDRPADANKGTFGRVLVVGGHGQMIGAPVLAGTAALRAGAGLVQIAVEAAILSACLTITPELIGLSLPKTGVPDELIQAAETADAVILGPGLGQSATAKAIVKRLIQINKPMVIDADALNILAAATRWPAKFGANAVLTPHPGEMKRLGGLIDLKEIPRDDDGRIRVATAAAVAFKQVVLLKGQRTVVTDGHRVHLNHTGDNALAKAGSGDVLSGVIASLIGQGMTPFDAACCAAWVHGRAGELAGKVHTPRSALARDVIDQLGPAFDAYKNVSPTKR